MTELGDVLADVRKSYRLVWAYQRRMMDLIQVVSESFDEMKFYAWTPLHTRRPTQLTTSPFEGKWAWDMIPFYKVSFLYKLVDGDPQSLRAGDWMFEIHLDADTAGFQNHRGEPDAARFPDADGSQSTLTLIAWQCVEPTMSNWFREVWSYGSWPVSDGAVELLTEYPVRTIKQTTQLEELGTRGAVQKMVREFKTMIAENFGIAA